MAPEMVEPMIRVLIQQRTIPHYRVPVFRELARRGFDVTVMFSSDPGLDNAQPEGITPLQVPLRELSIAHHTALWQPESLRQVRSGSYDVAILSWDLHYVFLVPSLLAARMGGVATLLWGHGYSKQESRWRRQLRLVVARLADGCLFYNQGGAASAVAKGLDPQRVFVAINSLDQAGIQPELHRWRQDRRRLDTFRREQRLEGPVVLFVSRLDPRNRVDLLIRAVARLKRRLQGITLAIVGKGPDLDRLQRVAGEEGLGADVRFVGPLYQESALASWFCAADVFCYPTNAGLSLLHAMGYGVPVVTSDHTDSHNPEIEAVKHEINGLLFRHGDVSDLAAKLHRVIADQNLRGRLSVHAHRTATCEFTVERMIDGFETAIRSTLHRRNSVGGRFGKN